MVFCDWLSIYQDFTPGTLPILNNGNMICVDVDGEVEFRTTKKLDQVGSYDTKIRFLCDGTRIVFEGNIGRYGRPDNVFGFSVLECVRKASDFLETFCLPRFTQIEGNVVSARTDGFISTGAVITRVDITKNYAAGSHERAALVAHYMGGQAIAGASSSGVGLPKTYANGVSWNEGSKYWYAKLYLKGMELGTHVAPEVKDWVLNAGILRHEISLKSRYLKQHGLQDLRAWTFGWKAKGENMENIIYGKFSPVLTRNTVQTNPFEGIPSKLRRIALDWRDGADIWGDPDYKIRSKQIWRKALLPYGIDIKVPCNVTRLATRVEVIQLESASMPAGYWALSQFSQKAA